MLRRYRATMGASYFVTLCTRERGLGLNRTIIATSINDQLIALERGGALTIPAAVIMPDHLHMLLLVGAKMTVGQVVGRMKAKTRGVLLAAGLGWQSNFYEHRLRPDDSVEDVLRYIFLNAVSREIASGSGELLLFLTRRNGGSTVPPRG
jgi:putative transposase